MCIRDRDRVGDGVGDGDGPVSFRVVILGGVDGVSGRDQGLWYEGFNGMAYDCMDASDEKGCMGI